MVPSFRHLITAFALAFACDSGYDLDTTITVPADIAANYSVANQGLLLVRYTVDTVAPPTLREVAVLCGEAGDFTTGDVGDGTVMETQVTAWIEPVTGRTCGPIGPNVLEDSDFQNDDDEPQASATAEAEAGCGGHEASIALTLSAP
ncbi:hypothetical protein [Nannocystis sp. SCPEA4]|uniref:hypothetical protein n=1 Tax=Nannocystis sp. SCPEA4 TaxID=2996787 RepID=UPI00226DAF76|nr:hypothetical protein [Nannocystis sp. SCPEA4]MCY1057510.1 hypothetical protein [Nannocystis sp. SCPEA4]